MLTDALSDEDSVEEESHRSESAHVWPLWTMGSTPHLKIMIKTASTNITKYKYKINNKIQ